MILSTGNVAFVLTRVMLLMGNFNYGARGILYLTHTRLFTFSSFRELFEQAGFQVDEIRGIPAPFPLAVGYNWLGRSLLAINKILIRISRSLFSYQIFMVVRAAANARLVARACIRDFAAAHSAWKWSLNNTSDRSAA